MTDYTHLMCALARGVDALRRETGRITDAGVANDVRATLDDYAELQEQLRSVAAQAAYDLRSIDPGSRRAAEIERALAEA